MKQIPNLFTLLNLFLGCIAIIFILQTGESLVMQNDEGSWVAQLPEKIWWGSACIALAAIVDFLDGFVARIFKATSLMGKQLDSLADVVSFGVAPGMILYQLLRISYIQEETALDTSLLALLPAMIFPCAGAYRLARFNIQDTGDNGFRGVPIPAAALVVASLPLILIYNYFNLTSILVNKWVFYTIIIVLSALMISKIPMLAFKFSDFSLKKILPFLILTIITVVSYLLCGWLAVPIVFICYILISLAFKNSST